MHRPNVEYYHMHRPNVEYYHMYRLMLSIITCTA